MPKSASHEKLIAIQYIMEIGRGLKSYLLPLLVFIVVSTNSDISFRNFGAYATTGSSCVITNGTGANNLLKN